MAIGRVRLGRGSNAQKSRKKRGTDGPTDRPRDTPSYRVTCTRLKIYYLGKKKSAHVLPRITCQNQAILKSL